jgi:hypothetical protein
MSTEAVISSTLKEHRSAKTRSLTDFSTQIGSLCKMWANDKSPPLKNIFVFHLDDNEVPFAR